MNLTNTLFDLTMNREVKKSLVLYMKCKSESKVTLRYSQVVESTINETHVIREVQSTSCGN